MKALWMLVLAIVVVWWWRQRSGPRVPPTVAKPPAALPQPTVRCAQCGLVLPESESIAGLRGRYCSAEHQRQAEPQTRA